MLSDKKVTVTYTNDASGDLRTIDIVITGEQIGQTVRRRVSTLLPTATIKNLEDKQDQPAELVKQPGGTGRSK